MLQDHPADRLAAEQSRRRLLGTRIVGLLVAAVMVGIILSAVNRDYDESEVYAVANNAAYELERTPVQGLGVTVFDVEKAVSVGNRGDGGRFPRDVWAKVRLRDAGSDPRGADRYELTNSDGDHPVCMVVWFDRDLSDESAQFASVSVERGAC
ncbi:hypothetical protein ACN28C_07075 [Plantactinospora sp. WMMC1484]|uniref:hypothetical protein n=1 Tax=Plantactinospora sp. WMMC1484 TaxID=3404122 RepID=UPI003BF492A1